jgi:hypothetical protein
MWQNGVSKFAQNYNSQRVFQVNKNSFCRCNMHYLVTPRSRVLLGMLTGFQLFKKFPRNFMEPEGSITAFTSARHLSLSWASSIQSITPHPTSCKIHLTIILPSTPGSPQWSLSLRFSNQNPVHTSPLPHMRHLARPSHSSWFYYSQNIGWARCNMH